MQQGARIITKIDANPMLSERRNEYRQLRVAAYCRVSTDSEDQVESYKAQVAYYTDAIAKNPRWKMADIYAD
ncbi:MAG: recombinase family protein, partial [Ruminococcus sp.]